MDHLYLPTSEEGRRQLQQNAAKFAKQITNMLWRVPRPLLLLLKTNDCLRTVDGCLGQVRPSLFLNTRSESCKKFCPVCQSHSYIRSFPWTCLEGILCVQSVNTFIITARECTRALNEARLEQHASIRTWLVCAADSLGVEFRIAALKLMAWWSSVRVTLKLDRQPRNHLAPPTPSQSIPAA